MGIPHLLFFQPRPVSNPASGANPSITPSAPSTPTPPLATFSAQQAFCSGVEQDVSGFIEVLRQRLYSPLWQDRFSQPLSNLQLCSFDLDRTRTWLTELRGILLDESQSPPVRRLALSFYGRVLEKFDVADPALSEGLRDLRQWMNQDSFPLAFRYRVVLIYARHFLRLPLPHSSDLDFLGESHFVAIRLREIFTDERSEFRDAALSLFGSFIPRFVAEPVSCGSFILDSARQLLTLLSSPQLSPELLESTFGAFASLTRNFPERSGTRHLVEAIVSPVLRGALVRQGIPLNQMAGFETLFSEGNFSHHEDLQREGYHLLLGVGLNHQNSYGIRFLALWFCLEKLRQHPPGNFALSPVEEQGLRALLADRRLPWALRQSVFGIFSESARALTLGSPRYRILESQGAGLMGEVLENPSALVWAIDNYARFMQPFLPHRGPNSTAGRSVLLMALRDYSHQEEIFSGASRLLNDWVDWRRFNISRSLVIAERDQEFYAILPWFQQESREQFRQLSAVVHVLRTSTDPAVLEIAWASYQGIVKILCFLKRQLQPLLRARGGTVFREEFAGYTEIVETLSAQEAFLEQRFDAFISSPGLMNYWMAAHRMLNQAIPMERAAEFVWRRSEDRRLPAPLRVQLLQQCTDLMLDGSFVMEGTSSPELQLYFRRLAQFILRENNPLVLRAAFSAYLMLVIRLAPTVEITEWRSVYERARSILQNTQAGLSLRTAAFQLLGRFYIYYRNLLLRGELERLMDDCFPLVEQVVASRNAPLLYELLHCDDMLPIQSHLVELHETLIRRFMANSSDLPLARACLNSYPFLMRGSPSLRQRGLDFLTRFRSSDSETQEALQRAVTLIETGD